MLYLAPLVTEAMNHFDKNVVSNLVSQQGLGNNLHQAHSNPCNLVSQQGLEGITFTRHTQIHVI